MFLALLVGLVASAVALSPSSALQKIDLKTGNVAWTLSSCDGSVPRIAGNVPGNVHTDLLAANVLKEDIYYRFNEVNMSWVTAQCWLYETEVSLGDRLTRPVTATNPLFLRLDGVDTVAEVTVNGKAVINTDNSFRSYVVKLDDVSSSSLTVTVRLASAADEAKKRAAAYPYEVPETANYNVWAEPSSRNFLRKAGSDFGIID